MTSESPSEPPKELKDTLFNIILHGRARELPAFLEKHPDCVRWRFAQDLTPLMDAVSGQNPAIVEMLLKAGARVDDVANDGYNAMYYAGRSPQCIDLLLAAGADINAKKDDGATALINAVDHGFMQCATMLIDRNADLECKGWNGSTPLLTAAFKGDAVLCARLLRAGADMNAVDSQGRNALQIAQWGYDNNTTNDKYAKTLDVLRPAFAAKTREELRATVDEIGRKIEEGTANPVAIGKALRFRGRFERYFLAT